MRWALTSLFPSHDDGCQVAAVDDVAQLPAWSDGASGVATVSALLLRIGPAGRPAVLVCGSACSGHFQSAHLELASSIAPIVSQALLRAEEHRRLRLEIAERARIEAEFKHQQTAMVHMQKMEAVAQLAAGMAHEINTPLQYASDNLRFLTTALAAISGAIPTLTSWLEPHMDKAVLRQFLDMADIDYLTTEAPKAAEQCREGVDRVGAIVLSLKRFAATDAGSAEPADINDAVRTTLAVCTGELRETADLQLELGELPPVPCRVAEIRQVLHSFLINAVRAIDDRPAGGRGTISVSTRALPAAVEIAVVDDGCGMDAETLRRACEPFFTTRTVGHGSGQGLAIAHEVARSHGGELILTSVPGQGTRVCLVLPLVPPSGQPEQDEQLCTDHA